jgi:hypothetical protein
VQTRLAIAVVLATAGVAATYAGSYYAREQHVLEADYDVVRYVGYVPRDFYTPMAFVESAVKGKRVIVLSDDADGNQRSRQICPFWRRAEEHWRDGH